MSNETKPAQEPQWKHGNEFAPFHPQASHVNPDHRDGWNACFKAAESALATERAAREGADTRIVELMETQRKFGALQHEFMNRAEAAEQRAEALRKDAERYHWLRDKAVWMAPPAADGEMVWCVKGPSATHCAPCESDELDAAIDAALAADAAISQPEKDSDGLL